MRILVVLAAALLSVGCAATRFTQPTDTPSAKLTKNLAGASQLAATSTEAVILLSTNKQIPPSTARPVLEWLRTVVVTLDGAITATSKGTYEERRDAAKLLLTRLANPNQPDVIQLPAGVTDPAVTSAIEALVQSLRLLLAEVTRA